MVQDYIYLMPVDWSTLVFLAEPYHNAHAEVILSMDQKEDIPVSLQRVI